MAVAVIIIMLVIVTVALYACLVTASQADDWEAEYWRDKK